MNRLNSRLIMVAICAFPFILIACNEKPSQNREAIPYGITPNSDPHAIDQQGNPLQPINPIALHKSITFNEGSTNLSETAKEELDTLQSEIQKDKNQYLTIRIEDEDTIDATAPSKNIQELTADRTSAVIEHLKRQGVEFMGVAIDHTGEVSNDGEGNPMAKPDATENESNAEYVTVTIEVDDK